MLFTSILGSRVPVVVGASAIDGGDVNVTSVNCPMPAGVATGDMLLLTGAARRGGPTSVFPPGGWTLLVNSTSGDELRQMAVFYKLADGSEGATITVTTNAGARLVASVIAVRGATQINGSIHASNGIPDPPLLNAGFSAKLWMAVESDVALPPGIIAMPPSYSLVQGSHRSIDDGLNNRLRLSTASRYLDATSETPGDFNPGGTGQYVAATLALA